MKLLEAFLGLSFFEVLFAGAVTAFVITFGIIWFISRETDKNTESSGFDDEFIGGSAPTQQSRQRRLPEDWEQ